MHEHDHHDMEDTLGHKTVLVADDDADLVKMLSLRLESMGFRVVGSSDAMHALLGTHRVKPDLVIVDVNMPGGNGLSVCEMLAGDEELARIPIIVMTGQSDDEVKRRCEGVGAHYLMKGPGLWDRIQQLATHLLQLPVDSAKEEREPVVAPSNDIDEPVATDTCEGDKQRPCVLCIDDDPEISKILKLRLDPYGVDVIRAFSGTQGFWTAVDMHPDVIITDLTMPDGEGNYVFGRLSMHPVTENTPVLILSGVSNPAVKRQMLGLGVDAFLSKPLVLEEILEHLRKYIKLTEPHDDGVVATTGKSS